MKLSKLTQMSRTFYDDNQKLAEQRFFVGMEGDEAALKVQLVTNVINLASRAKRLHAEVHIARISVEYCNSIVKNLAETALAYKRISKFQTLNIAKKQGLAQRRIELYTPFYLAKQLFVTKTLQERSSVRPSDTSVLGASRVERSPTREIPVVDQEQQRRKKEK